jgi:cyclohexanone monooxygenase
MILACEQHVDWIADCIQYMRGRGLSCIEAEQAAEDAWVQYNNPSYG